MHAARDLATSRSLAMECRTDNPGKPVLLDLVMLPVAAVIARSCGRKGSTIQHDMVMPLLALRHHMGLLIGNLQVYLQVDVVESNFAQLQAKVAQAQVGIDSTLLSTGCYTHNFAIIKWNRSLLLCDVTQILGIGTDVSHKRCW